MTIYFQKGTKAHTFLQELDFNWGWGGSSLSITNVAL